MIKMLTLCLVAITTVLFASAQKAEWKEMHHFHEIMSQTFHPAENGNLQPTKDNINELLQRAKAWQASAVPAGYNKKAVKPVLARLVRQIEMLQAAIAHQRPDSELKTQISAAHDTFHEIMETCKK